MIKTASRILMAASAFSMATAPVIANANTRAGDSGAVYTVSEPGMGMSDEGEEVAVGISLAVALASFGAVVVGILIASGVIFDDEDEDVSPGT